MKGYCCDCGKEIECEIVGGNIIYPHRSDLYDLEFIRCPICRNYTQKYDGEFPILPSRYIRSCRQKAHRALDFIWKDKKMKGKYYKYMSSIFGKDFHWGMVKDKDEADKALDCTIKFIWELKTNNYDKGIWKDE